MERIAAGRSSRRKCFHSRHRGQTQRRVRPTGDKPKHLRSTQGAERRAALSGLKGAAGLIACAIEDLPSYVGMDGNGHRLQEKGSEGGGGPGLRARRPCMQRVASAPWSAG